MNSKSGIFKLIVILLRKIVQFNKMLRKDFTEALKRLNRGLNQYALKLTKDHTDASDLYQEMVFKAFKSLHQFKDDTNLRAWLMTIMRNIFINDYRRKRKRPIYQDGSDNNFLIDQSSVSVENEGSSKIAYEDLSYLVDQLDKTLSVPFLLAFEGYKYDEIADELNVPLGTIKSRIFMARKKLKQNFKRHYRISFS